MGASLGYWISQVTVGPTVDSVIAESLLNGIAAGVLPFVGIVYSLLFLVVQFGSTNLTPRLNLFRDDPLVWRSFSYFVGLFVWSATAAVTVREQDRVSVLVPIAAVVGVLAALLVFRRLETAAFASIQLAPTLRDIREHGRAVIGALYWQAYDGEPDEPTPLPDVRTALRWDRPGGVLRQLDLPALTRAAVAVDGIIELTVTPGDTVREGAVVAQVRGGHGDVDGTAVMKSFEVGLERTFDQDPLFAFRLLADIGIRALSAAVNDQATAVQVIDTIDGLLTALRTRRLDVGRVHSADGRLQVVIPVPTWSDYVDAAVSDIARSGGTVVPVSDRLLRLLDDLAEGLHPSRRAPLDSWRRRLLSMRESGPSGTASVEVTYG
ncbi:MAG: DUF2254 domain-containing protein [Cellulomonadaceae bacterium]|nr:DUF2254 domain-containing protein [Cellulomonadaceae bacterium]